MFYKYLCIWIEYPDLKFQCWSFALIWRPDSMGTFFLADPHWYFSYQWEDWREVEVVIFLDFLDFLVLVLVVYLTYFMYIYCKWICVIRIYIYIDIFILYTCIVYLYLCSRQITCCVFVTTFEKRKASQVVSRGNFFIKHFVFSFQTAGHLEPQRVMVWLKFMNYMNFSIPARSLFHSEFLPKRNGWFEVWRRSFPIGFRKFSGANC